MTLHADQVADAVRAVLDAARTWVRTPSEPGAMRAKLTAAVDALEALLPVDAVTFPDGLPWSEVLAGDETQGADGNWYRVASVSGSPRGVVEVAIDVRGRVNEYTKPGDVMVPVRRKVSPEASAVALLRQAGFDLTTLMSRS